MLFFKIEYITDQPFASDSRESPMEERMRICGLCADINAAMDPRISCIVAAWDGRRCEVICAVDTGFAKGCDIGALADEFTRSISIRGTRKKLQEISQVIFCRKLTNAVRSNFIENDEEFTKKHSLSPYDELCFPSEAITELLIESSLSPEIAQRQAQDMLCAESLLPELKRICRSNADVFRGHPVHYILSADGDVTVSRIRTLLLGALLYSKRLVSRRYIFFDTSECHHYPAEDLHALYRSMDGGAIVFRCSSMEDDADVKYSGPDFQDMQVIAAVARRHRHDVLTIFETTRRNASPIKRIQETMSGTPLISLAEDIVFQKKARTYLKHLAKEKGAAPDQTLLRSLPEAERGYTAAELQLIFQNWYDVYLRTRVYPAYAKLAVAQHKELNRPKGDAYRELQELIGLAQVKEVVAQAIAFHKAQKLFAERDFNRKQPSMHMVFTGNPGTAKTTVARLVAQIMKDNGLLPVGGLVEVGRADLVGRYVGWTAPAVQDAFTRARGSVLFIDEAYSLVDDRDGLYGDEAISTIVQEMENRREDTVVIFAGYPDKMEQFLSKNPGLRSRIAFHVPFPDYSAEELFSIFRLMLDKKGLSLAEDATVVVRKILADACLVPDFGNGRYVRNLLEKAELKQALRLVDKPQAEVTNFMLRTLTLEDMQAPCLVHRRNVRTIGL